MMKKKLLTIAIVCLGTILCRAATLTVSNNPNGGAQYATLQDAYDAASDGDILLIEGTDIMYFINGCLDQFAKRLTLIGIGFNPDKTLPKKTKIGLQPGCNTSNNDIEFEPGSSGSKIYGIEFLHIVGAHGDDLLFEDCKFNRYVSITGNNLIMRNCIWDDDNNFNLSFSTSAIINASFENCLFDGFADANNNPSLNATFNHCLFLRTNAAPLEEFNGSAIVRNCIFMNFAGAADVSTTGCTFDNNIARLAATLPPTGNSGTGNVNNTDPLFVNYILDTHYSPTHDYDVQAGSLAIGAADDGTDIGIHGGTSSFSETGEVLVTPIVRSVIINNTTVSPGGTLNVQVEAGKPNID